jgi:hypothetical protein
MESLVSWLYGQSFSAFCPPSADDRSAPLGGHPHEKAVRSFSLCIAEIRQVLFHLLDPSLFNELIH